MGGRPPPHGPPMIIWALSESIKPTKSQVDCTLGVYSSSPRGVCEQRHLQTGPGAMWRAGVLMASSAYGSIQLTGTENNGVDGAAYRASKVQVVYVVLSFLRSINS